jgi:hypothetical protein
MGKRVIISKNSARIRMNEPTKGREAKAHREIFLRKALTLHVHKGAESSNLIRRSVLPQLDERG